MECKLCIYRSQNYSFFPNVSIDFSKLKIYDGYLKFKY